jgi:Ferritin-like
MSGAEYEWLDYDLSLPARLVGQIRHLTSLHAAITDEQLAADASAMIEVTVQIPDLTSYPTPMGKAKILLESAAEVEHALMVQYLYAGYSLKEVDEVEPAHQDVLDDNLEQSWPQTLRAMAREEMGHLMTVQNLLLILDLLPNFDRQDFPFRSDLYPFELHLQPLTQSSLAKYVVAESPADAAGIADIIEVASAKAGSPINRVGVIYGLLGLVFAREDQVAPGATGHPHWDAIVRVVAGAAYTQDGDRQRWHLPDSAFRPESLAQQADPDDWRVGALRVHRIADRVAALDALRDIGEQGEGPSGSGETSHFERFLSIYRGDEQFEGFPKPRGWVPTRGIPRDPKPADFTVQRTRDWAQLADLRYALLLGYLSHYLSSSGDVRSLLTGWIVAEMRSRLGPLARELTSMPVNSDSGSKEYAAACFTLPNPIALPNDEVARWRLHQQRTADAIDITQRLLSAEPEGPLNHFLALLLTSDQARLQTIKAMEEHQPITPSSYVRDIQPLFRPKDISHMADNDLRLDNLEEFTGAYGDIAFRISHISERFRMPSQPDPRWTPGQLRILSQWIDDGLPP